jgi:hypothetical protein
MRRSMLAAATLVAVLGGAAVAALGQAPPGFRGPVFRVEPETRSEFRRTGYVTGWVYNDGQGIAGLVRMKVQMLDESGKVVAEHIGWAYGNVTAGGRAYFMIPIPPQSPPERRVVVDSWVIQSYGEGRSESP